MKKLLICIAAFACAAILFAGCEKESAYQATDVANVSISISDVSSKGATVTIKDTNKNPYIYGRWYQVEREKDGQWYAVKPVIDNYGFDDMGYLPDAQGELKFVIDWQWLYGELPSGNYRLLKQVNSQYICISFWVGTPAS